jgi:hypothetical protein
LMRHIGELGIQRRGLRAFMSHLLLNRPQVQTRLDQMRTKTMA